MTVSRLAGADRARLRYRSAMPARRSSWLRRWSSASPPSLALLVVAIASLPLFVDGDRVRRAVEQRISAVAGGEVRYESLKLRFFPQPSVEARNATVRIPGALDGRIGTLAIRIALLPLLTGNVRPVAVERRAAGARGHDPARRRQRRRRSVRRVPGRARSGRRRARPRRERDVARDHRRQGRRGVRGAADRVALRARGRRAGRGGCGHRQRERCRGSVAHRQGGPEDRAGFARGDGQAAAERPAPGGAAAGGRRAGRGARKRRRDRRVPRRADGRTRERARDAHRRGAGCDAARGPRARWTWAPCARCSTRSATTLR